MLGYTKADIDNMKYGVDCALLLINPKENPVVHQYLTEVKEFFDDNTSDN
jgi:hypothetical protein